MRFTVSVVLLAALCIVVSGVPQKSPSDMKKEDAKNDDPKNEDAKENSSNKVQMVEKALYSDQNCQDVIIRQFYEADDGIGCGAYSNGACGSNGDIGSHMYKCPAEETELDMKEYVRLDVYNTEDCSGTVSTTSYFPRKNEGKCIPYDKFGKNTESRIFKIEGETLSVGWIDCNNLETFTKGKCVDGAIANF
ncbi:hypothetical protein MP638_004991 [Amoeboaphelidium occidentale]|nr:hypothetical protein MP638_004991 [Amoeboaphelidium occidentale]